MNLTNATLFPDADGLVIAATITMRSTFATITRSRRFLTGSIRVSIVRRGPIPDTLSFHTETSSPGTTGISQRT
jgi:hypothetical protein